MFTIPNNNRDREKNALIALIAAINSVAVLSMYVYQFHALGTKKCQIPKPIEALLPIITNIFTSIFVTPSSPAGKYHTVLVRSLVFDYNSIHLDLRAVVVRDITEQCSIKIHDLATVAECKNLVSYLRIQ